MWLPVLLSIPPLALVALVLWATWDLFGQNRPEAVAFWLLSAVAIVPPVAWAIAAV